MLGFLPAAAFQWVNPKAWVAILGARVKDLPPVQCVEPKLGEFVTKQVSMTRRSAVGGSIATLLSLTGQPIREAEAQFVKAAGGKPSTDLLILDPSSPRFTGLTQGFNRRWSAPRCNQILLPLTEAGAMEALDRVIDSGRGKFRIRGGGHCYEDFVFNGEAQTLIDVSLLNEIGFDAQNGVYYAQSGASIWDLYRELYWRFGLTLPAGSCYSVGLGGHICGGGYGTLSRQFGLTVDWLTGVRVATVDHNERPLFNHATKEDSPPLRELWWSHTGGGWVCRIERRVRSGWRSSLPITTRPSRCTSQRRLQPC